MVRAPGAGHRQPGDAAGPLPALEVALVAEHVVRTRHRGAADPDRVGEVALARQPDADRDPALRDQGAEAVGQPAKRG